MDTYKALHALLKEGVTTFPNLILRYRTELDISDSELGQLLYEYYQESTGGPQSIALRRALEKAAALWEKDTEPIASSLVMQVTDDLRCTLDAAQDLLARPLGTRDLDILAKWHYDLRFDRDMVLHIISTCQARKKFHLSYMDKVAESWHKAGILNKADAIAAEKLAEQRRSLGSEIGSYLGLRKVLSKPEERMLIKWSEEWQFNKAVILLACDQVVHTDKPSFRYVDAVLKAWKDEGLMTEQAVKERLCAPRKAAPSRRAKTPENQPQGRPYDAANDDEWIRLSIQNATRKQDKP